MAQLIVRKIEDEVKQRIVERARRHGHSMEEELRTILREAVRDMPARTPETDMGTRLSVFFAKHGLQDADVEEFKDEPVRAAIFR